MSDHHYFATSCLHWEQGHKIHEIVSRLKRRDRSKKSLYKASTYAVYRVPVPIETKYDVRDYTPQVEGTELVYTEEY